jgi:hypothetical protein
VTAANDRNRTSAGRNVAHRSDHNSRHRMNSTPWACPASASARRLI